MGMGFTWKVIEKTLEGTSQRFKATSRNLANVNTPGYARRNVSFEDELKDFIYSDRKLKMNITKPGHIPSKLCRRRRRQGHVERSAGYNSRVTSIYSYFPTQK